MPAAKSTRDQHEPEPRSADRDDLDHQHGGDQRGGEDEGHGGEAAGGHDQHPRLRRRVASRQADQERGPPGAECDQRRLGPEHEPGADCDEAREQHAGQLLRPRRGAGRQPVRRDVTAIAWQPRDRERHQQRRDREHRKRPPLRRSVRVAERVGEVCVELLLELVDPLEEAPRRERHQHADHRDEHQQHEERPAADGGVGLLGGELRCGVRRCHTGDRG